MNFKIYQIGENYVALLVKDIYLHGRGVNAMIDTCKTMKITVHDS